MTLDGRWPKFGDDEIEAAKRVLTSGKVNYWTGVECDSFEREFAEACNANHAISLSNGTMALELALEAAGIGSGDDVVVTPRTFIASASCVVRRGGRPVFADVDPDSQNITPATVEAVLTPQTRAIVVVHHAGWPCEMDGFMNLARTRGLVVIEDCAQAIGAKFKDEPVGTLGHVAAFSFCQDKIISTGGEGGMLVTNDAALWKRAWAIKDHGKSFDAVSKTEHPLGFRWLHQSFGTNMRMTEFQAAIGRLQLRKLMNWKMKRNSNAKRLIETLRKYCLRIPIPAANIDHAYYRLYAFVVPEKLADGWDRDRIVREVTADGIPCFSGSCPEVYNEKAFVSAGLHPRRMMPNARELGSVSLAFLVHPTLTLNDMDRTCQVLNQVLSSATA